MGPVLPCSVYHVTTEREDVLSFSACVCFLGCCCFRTNGAYRRNNRFDELRYDTVPESGRRLGEAAS